jgi:hypothetical protein
LKGRITSVNDTKRGIDRVNGILFAGRRIRGNKGEQMREEVVQREI